MAQRKSTLSKDFLEKLQERNSKDESQKIQTPSGGTNVTVETLVALSGLMAGIWGGTQALSAVKEGFDPKSVIKGQGNKFGLRDLFVMSDKIMQDIIKNDKHIFGKKGGEKALSLIDSIDTNIKKINDSIKKFISPLSESLKGGINTQHIKLDVSGNFDAKQYKELLETFTDPGLDRLTEEDFVHGLRLVIDTLKQFGDLQIGKLTGNVSTQLADLISTVDENVTKLENIDNIRVKILEFKQGIEDIHIDSEAGVFKDLQNIIEKMSIIASYDTRSISLEPIIDAIGALNDEKLQEILESSNTTLNFARLIELIENKDNGLNGVILAIKKIAAEGENLDQKSSEGIIGVTNAIATILSIDTSLTSVIKLQKSIQLMKPLFEKDLKELVAVIIKNFGDKETKSVLSQLRNIQGIFSVISSLGINPLRIVAASINIKMIRGSLIKNVFELFKEIAKVTNETKEPYKDAIKGINNLREIIKLITGVSSMPLNRKVGMLIDFEYIRAFVLPTIKRMLSSIIDLNGDYKESVTRSIQDLSTLFETLTKIADIKDETIDGMRENVQELDLIIGSDLSVLFEDLKKLPVSKDDITKSEKINALIMSIVSEFDAMPGLLKFYLAEEKYDVISEIVKTTSMIVDTVNNIKLTKSTLKKYDDINELLNKVKILLTLDANSSSKKLKNISQSIEQLNDAVLQMIKISGGSKAIELSAKVYAKIPNILKDFVEGFKGINKKDIDNATKIIKEMNKIVITSAGVLLFAALVSMVIPMKDVFQFAMSLGLFILMFSGAIRLATPKLLKDSHETIHEFGNLILTSAFVLLFGSIVYHFIKIEDLFGFAATLGLFMWGMMKILANNNIQTDIENSWETMREFGYLILISGATLILGSVIYHFLEWKDLFGFVFGLGVFMFAMTGIYGALSIVADQALEGAKDFALIITASGFVLMLGALLYSAVPWKYVFGFTLQLTAFLGIMMLLFAAPQLLSATKFGKKIPGLGGLGNPFEKAMKGAKDFAILILASGFVLFLGSAISKAIDLGGLTLFTVELAAFIFAVMAPFIFAKTSGMMKIAEKSGKEFGVLLLFSTLVLMIGGLLFTLYPQIIPGTALFALVLGGFIWAVCTAFSKVKARKIWPKVAAILLITTISGAILLYAGWVMHKFPDAAYTIPIFTGCVLALTGGMAFILNKLSKSSASFKKGIIALLSISVALGITSLAFKKLAETAAIIQNAGGVGQFALIVGTMVGTLAVVSAGIVGLAFALGNGATTTMAYLAIGVVLAGAAAIWVVADAMQKTAKALDTLSKVKPIKVDQLISNVSAIISIAGALTPLVAMTPAIVASSLAVEAMAHMMSSIAEAVQDYASLKVPIYEGMKQVGYRQLSKGDFKEAGKNVSLIIKTLGKAVIDAYEQNPEIFEANLLGFGRSKFQIVAKSLGTLGPMLSSIAESVQQYASLRVGTDYKKNSMGILMPTNYRQLNKGDFKSAAYNVKEIITVLGSAVIETYDEKPEIFEEPTFFGKSKFSKVVKSLTGLGPMLAKIASSVKDYANLNVGEDYQKDPKLGVLMPTKYRHLDDKDFKSAATNVKHIINVLGGAIIDAYEEHPEYYETEGGILGFGASSPFTKTIKANMMLGTMISKIASSVKDYASLMVGEDYQKDPKLGVLMPTRYRHLDDKDFQSAARNVVSIMSTLGNAIITVYEANPTYYDTSGGVLGFGASSPFTKTIKANMMLGTMISKIASAVKDYASLMVGEDYQKDPKLGILMPTRYRHLDDDDFRKAAKNVQTILETLGGAIISTYKKHENDGMYDNSGLFGTGDSPFIKTINANLKLAELISTIGKSVKDLADFKIGEAYEKNSAGMLMPTKYRHLGPGDFKNAADNISLIIGTLGSAIMTAYKDHEEWFEDGEDSIFAQACKAIGTMGTMINEIAHGVQGYADMKVAKYDDKGNIAGYDKIDDKMFTRASNHISKLITNLGKTVISTYEQHPDWFDDGEESKFTLACTAISGMGEMIGSVAEGIQSYAELKVPIKWDDKGNPIEYRELNDDIFESASKNIGLIVTNLGESIEKVYNQHPNWFKSELINIKSGIFSSESKESDPPFIKAIQGCIMMGELISSIAEGIQDYAAGKMPIKWDKNGNPVDWVKMDDGVYSAASQKIGEVITWIGTTIATIYENHKEWFAPTTVKTKDGGWFGSDEFKESDPPFIKAIKSCLLMGNVISNIAEGIQKYAELYMPVYDKNGVFTGKYTKLPDTIFDEAGTNIGKVITGIGKALKLTYENNKELFEDDKYKDIVNSTSKIGTIISSIAKGIQTYASLRYPVEWDKNGNPIKFQKMDDTTISDATDKISKILTTIGDTVADVADDEIFNKFNIAKVNNMLESMKKTSSVISMMAKTIRMYATMEFVEYDPVTKAKTVQKLNEQEIQKATESIAKVLTTIGTAIIDTVGNNTVIFGQNANKLKTIITGCKLLVGATNSIFTTVNEIVKLGTTDNTKKLEKIAENLKQYIQEFKKISAAFIGMPIFKGISGENAISNNLDMIEKLVDRLLPILNKINGIKDGGELKTLLSLTETFMNIVARLKGMVSNKDENKIDFSTFNFEDTSKDLNEKINLFADNVDRVIDLSEHSKEIGTEGLNNISTGISEVDRVLQEIKGIENFTKHNVQLDKYVQTVNKLQLSKINGLTDMIKAMNTLTSRLGNVDRLTEAIADKLSSVLDKLVSEMKEAEKIIKESEVIQKKRHELIEKSTKNVVEIMKQKLVVEISQVQDNAGLTGDTPGTGVGTGTQSGDGAGTPPGNNNGNISDGNSRGNSSDNNASQETSEGGTKVVAQSRNGNSGTPVYPSGNGSRHSSRTDTLLDGILAELKRGIKIKQ